MSDVKLTNEVIGLKDKRDSLVDKVEVLSKVKELLWLLELEKATIQQVADYYEVGVPSVRKIINKHEEEFILDGYETKSGKDIEGSYRDKMTPQEISIKKRGSYTVTKRNGDEYIFSSNKTGLFPKRAILRVGMLLRGSKVAEEVRAHLLNTEENAAQSVETYEIAPEMELHIRLKRAVATKLPALGDTFDNSEFESKQDRSHSLEGNFYSSITKSYVNGLVLCGLSFSLLLIKPFTNQEQIRQKIK
ncbi:hypothetical protein [Bacillus cereus]|uniref:hypothetical protein n=1 Tax=Bacillus cereus TaxID=1396 RepID=UPI00211D7331|nr:hypothetical protein [Bacillus cereus]